MSGSWYFTRDGKQRLGPFTFEQLCQLAAGGLLTPSNMVLANGSQTWVPASSVHGLFSPSSTVFAARHAVSVDADEQPAHAVEEPDPTHRTRRRMLWLALAIVGGLVLLPLPLALLASLDQQTLDAIGRSIPGLLFFAVMVGGFAAFIAGIIWAISETTGRLTACPECKRKWAKTLIEKKEIGRKRCYGLVTRRAYSSSSGSVSGTRHHWGQADYQTYQGSTHSSGSTSWQERVPVIRTTYLVTFECKYCQATWNEEKVEQVEDFDIERA